MTSDEMWDAGRAVTKILHDAGMTTGEALLCLAGVVGHSLADESEDRTQESVTLLNMLILQARSTVRRG
jgi:hypothetical protein